MENKNKIILFLVFLIFILVLILFNFNYLFNSEESIEIFSNGNNLNNLDNNLNGSNGEIKVYNSYNYNKKFMNNKNYVQILDYDKNSKEGYQTYVVLGWDIKEDIDNCFLNNEKIKSKGELRYDNFIPGNINSYNKTFYFECYKNKELVYLYSLNIIDWWRNN